MMWNLRVILLAVSFSFGLLNGSAPLSGQTVPPCKEATIRKVFEDIVIAINDTLGAPRLIITSKTNGEGAAYSPMEEAIYFQENLYDFCRRFDSDSLNALAWVLGHELAHYYKRHRFGGRSARVKDGRRMREIIRSKDSVVKYEEEADYFSGFYTRMAGYDALEIVPKVLEMLYQEYGDPKNKWYPDLQGRKRIALGVSERLEELIPVFDAATCLALIQWYPEAVQCLDTVIAIFPSRELLNNSGVAYTLHALDLMSGDNVGYVYPLELDADTRLGGVEVREGRIDRSTRGMDPADSLKSLKLLKSAQARFERASRGDPRYSSSLINLATVHILKGEYHEAISRAATAMAIDTGAMTKIMGATITSIAQARLGQREDARGRLKEIEALAERLGTAELVRANLAVLEEKTYQIPQSIGIGSSSEKVDDLRATEKEVIWRYDFTEPIDQKTGLTIVAKLQRNSYLVGARANTWWAQFISTRSYYSDTSAKGIRIGSPSDEVRKKYGDMPRIVNTRKGKYYIYDYSKIIFRIDTSGKVDKWFIYAMEK